MHLGKAIRSGRLFNKQSGRLLAITLDHAEPVEPTADPVVRGVYDRRYRVFLGLYPALRGIFGESRDHARRDGSTGPIGDIGVRNVAMGGFGTHA